MLKSDPNASLRLRRISREGFWVVAGRVTAIAGALVGVRLMTELLDPATYGELALGMTLATLVHETIFGPLATGATRFWSSAQEKGDLGGFLQVIRRLTIGASGLVVAIAAACVMALYLSGFADWIALAVAACILAVFRGQNAVLTGMQNAARQRIIVAFHQGVETWGRFLIAAALILWVGASSSITISGYAIAILLVLMSQWMFFRKLVNQPSSAEPDVSSWHTQIVQFSWPFAVFGVFTWAQVATGRWALELFATAQEVGFYAVLYQLGFYPMAILTGMVIQFLAPVFFQRAGDALDRQRNKNVQILGWRLTIVTIAVTVVATIAAWVLHDLVFRLLVADEYRSVSYLLPWLILAGGIISAGQTIELNLMSQFRTRSMITAKVMTAVFGIVLNFVGACLYGTPGIVAAEILFSIPYFLWMMLLAKRKA